LDVSKGKRLFEVVSVFDWN